MQKILMIPAILIGFTFHEYAHAKTADMLGDMTPRFQGRLSLNPFIHVDIFGLFMILFFGFGWAKPVETNPCAYKNYYKDDLKVSIAGPIANFLVAFISAIIYGILDNHLFKASLNSNLTNEVMFIILFILQFIVSINIMLFLFNLIPIPGLDGFHIIRDLFPKFFYKSSNIMYTYQILIIVLLIVPLPFVNVSLASLIMDAPVRHLTEFMFKIASFI